MINYVKCPFCGSDNIEQRFEKEHGLTISRGLPERFIHGGWFYFICKDCFQIYSESHDKDFVFTTVEGIYYAYIGKQELWILKGMTREVVEFT